MGTLDAYAPLRFRSWPCTGCGFPGSLWRSHREVDYRRDKSLVHCDGGVRKKLTLCFLYFVNTLYSAFCGFLSARCNCAPHLHRCMLTMNRLTVASFGIAKRTSCIATSLKSCIMLHCRSGADPHGAGGDDGDTEGSSQHADLVPVYSCGRWVDGLGICGTGEKVELKPLALIPCMGLHIFFMSVTRVSEREQAKICSYIRFVVAAVPQP